MENILQMTKMSLLFQPSKTFTNIILGPANDSAIVLIYSGFQDFQTPGLYRKIPHFWTSGLQSSGSMTTLKNSVVTAIESPFLGKRHLYDSAVLY
jgi:hypothetical protein